MIKYVLTSAFFCMLAGSSFAQDLTRKDLRETYYSASEDGDMAWAFYEKLAAADTTAPLLLAYKAMAGFMVSYHSTNPYHKLKYFIESRSALNRVIAQAPDNVELRFLRFTVQTNAPKFLGYYGNIIEDKTVLFAALNDAAASDLDTDLRQRVLAYMRGSPYCSLEERAQVEAMLGRYQ